MSQGDYNIRVKCIEANELKSPGAEGFFESDELRVVCKITIMGVTKKTKMVKGADPFWGQIEFFPF